SNQVITENLGLIYLSILSLVTFYFVMRKGEKMEKYLAVAAKVAFYTLNGLVITGLLWYFISGSTRLVLYYPDYPYFGDVVRVKGFNYSPNILISVYAFFATLKTSFDKYSKVDFGLTLLVALLSLTKEGLLLIVLATSLYLWKNYNIKKYTKPALILAGVFYLIFSQFVFSINREESDFSSSFAVNTASGFSVGNVMIYPTVYYYLFKSGFLLFSENILFGVGHGHFIDQLNYLTLEGRYPATMPKVTPMDSYFGVAAQLGVLYLVYLYLQWKNMKEALFKLESQYFPLSLLGLYFILESLSNGSIHFRHYYIYFGLCIALYYRAKTHHGPQVENKEA
ncbi:MAG TPA: hypothetical protein PK611_07075, partial [Saprospiraceae bacterium]|nr:hypothetical protein [Saprospiraceae bacterium]